MGVADSVYQVSVLHCVDSVLVGVRQQIACHCCRTCKAEHTDHIAFVKITFDQYSEAACSATGDAEQWQVEHIAYGKLCVLCSLNCVQLFLFKGA
jgi:hypothetical protein